MVLRIINNKIFDLSLFDLDKMLKGIILG